MTEATIADLFQIQSRFLRSAHLERDFADPRALKGYILTAEASDHLKRLASGMSANSGRRAWRITGNFGSGKSSFALFAAHLFSERSAKLPAGLRHAVNFKEVGVPRPRLLPVLITGSREPISVALLRALHRDLASACGRGRPPSVLERIKAAAESSKGAGVADDVVLSLIEAAIDYIVASGKATGLLIVLDELGKFLEYAALYPDKQDVFLMQRLAETAARSGRSPLFVIGLLHQGFDAYADNLSQTAQREWEKVAGRFDELLFNQPLEETAGLVGDALNIRLAGLPKTMTKSVRADMQATLRLGWYGATTVKEKLLANAVRLYPLHPTVLPVLVQLFGRFGQNQRSLFSFLLSNEPFGLPDFAQAPVSLRQSYRLHRLYDYARATFGHRLSLLSYRSHWNHIESLIESFPTIDAIELQVLKSVGLLNLIDANNLLATEEAIILAVAGEIEGISESRVRRAIKRLHREKGVLCYRGASGGYCLWPHTSVNLERAYDDAARALGSSPPQRVSPLIESYLETRPLVARRHYIETGNLRHYEVRFAPVEKLAESVRFSHSSADGRIVVALCETSEEHQEALRFARSGALQSFPEVLLAVPSALGILGKLVQELQRWEWVAANTPELNNDEYAREEVTSQIANARQTLEKRIQSLIGLQQFVGRTGLQWFRQFDSLEINNNRELLERLSNICDEVYALAPRVHNELINRRSLSAAANGARTRLLEGMFGGSSEPYLGMDPSKKPPEMAIYLSLLEKGGVHRRVGEMFALCEPETDADICNIRPALRRVGEILEERADRRVRLSDLVSELRQPPYGVRDGLSPILIALFAVLHEQHVAFYDQGKFMREMVGLDIMRLTKVPEVFEIQYCKVAGVRLELFKRLLSLLEQAPEGLSARRSTRSREQTDVLDVVRPLCIFAAQLPPYTHKTKRLSATALAVRSVLLSAREPSMLLFRDLPTACGFSVINADSKTEIVEGFVDTLRIAIEELRQAYSVLHERMKTTVSDLFGVSCSFASVRESLSMRAKSILSGVTEPRLKAFCLRLVDSGLAEAEWFDSLGSFVCSVPPQKWNDLDAERFVLETGALVAKFRRVESIAFENQRRAKNQLAVRIAITHMDGTEVDDVIFTTKEEESEIKRVQEQVTKLLRQNKRIGLAGAARAFSKLLQGDAIADTTVR
jgi:hypothetical protein